MTTACVLCGLPCVPMADWDFPVCVGCEDGFVRGMLPPPLPREHALPVAVYDDLRRLVHVLAELMAAS